MHVVFPLTKLNILTCSFFTSNKHFKYCLYEKNSIMKISHFCHYWLFLKTKHWSSTNIDQIKRIHFHVIPAGPNKERYLDWWKVCYITISLVARSNRNLISHALQWSIKSSYRNFQLEKYCLYQQILSRELKLKEIYDDW